MQNQNPSSKKSIIIIIVCVVLAGLAYFYFAGTPKDDGSFVTTDANASSEAAIAGAQILSLLNQINSLKIDPALFKSPVYSSLVDHTVPIYPQNIGKKNPFFYTPAPKAK